MARVIYLHIFEDSDVALQKTEKYNFLDWSLRGILLLFKSKITKLFHDKEMILELLMIARDVCLLIQPQRPKSEPLQETTENIFFNWTAIWIFLLYINEMKNNYTIKNSISNCLLLSVYLYTFKESLQKIFFSNWNTILLLLKFKTCFSE